MKTLRYISAQALLLTSTWLLSACGEHVTTVHSGLYLIGQEHRSSADPVLKDLSLQIDRSSSTAVFLSGGTSIASRTMTARAEGDWPVSCQTNFTSQRLEIFGLGAAELQIGRFVIQRPVLQASCELGDSPHAVIVRIDGDETKQNACRESGGLCDLPFKESK